MAGLSVPLNLSPISGVAVTAEAGAGSFTTQAGALGGPMPLLGVARLPIGLVPRGPDDQRQPVDDGDGGRRDPCDDGFRARSHLGSQLGGIVRLVTPILITTGLDALPLVPAFGILTVPFVPEPGTLALLSSGIVALGRTRTVKKGAGFVRQPFG